MISLGIDTSLSAVSFAVIKNSQIMSQFDGDVGRNLADRIGETIKNLLEKAAISACDVERCGIVVGPGSFTGLRVGIAFAKGFFANFNIANIVTVSSLECAAKSVGKTGEISVIFDARQDEVFFAKFKNGEKFIRVCDDERIPFQDAIEKRIKSQDVIVYSFCGNPNSPIKSVLGNAENCFEAEAVYERAVTAAKFAEISDNLQSVDVIFPNYMQASYAERCKK